MVGDRLVKFAATVNQKFRSSFSRRSSLDSAHPARSGENEDFFCLSGSEGFEDSQASRTDQGLGEWLPERVG
jgi:hypothetical protein